MNIALLGFGVVGRGVYDLVKNISGLQVTKVVCLEDVTLPDATVTKDFKDVLGDDIDIVVEAMGGLHPAFEFVSAAMEAGKHVVTSNKALVATYYDTLLPLAQKKGLCFRCTAAVGGGIGWLSELERSRRTQTITKEDVDTFTAHSLVCKLISTGRKEQGVYSAYVQPTLVSATSLEAAVPANYNLITLDGEASGRMSFYGQGAGRYPTAYNVVQDCADLLSGKGFYAPYGQKVAATNQNRLCYYVRGNADPWLEENTSQRWGSAVVTRPVSVADMHAWLKDHPEAFIAAIAK